MTDEKAMARLSHIREYGKSFRIMPDPISPEAHKLREENRSKTKVVPISSALLSKNSTASRKGFKALFIKIFLGY